MKLIIGLWNPWYKYKQTRHNIWFMFLDYLAQNENFPDFKLESKFKAEISIWVFAWEKTILLKPQTYMNLSWESIIKFMHFYKINIENIMVIYDDISMNFWKIRFREKGSSWGHNWIKDIIKHYWENFKRIKIWVWFNNNFEVSDWVLSKFNKKEFDELNNIFDKSYEILVKNI